MIKKKTITARYNKNIPTSTKNSNFNILPDINHTNPSFFHTKNFSNNDNKTLISTNYDTGNLTKFNFNSNLMNNLKNSNQVEYNNSNVLFEIEENLDKLNTYQNETSYF